MVIYSEEKETSGFDGSLDAGGVMVCDVSLEEGILLSDGDLHAAKVVVEIAARAIKESVLKSFIEPKPPLCNMYFNYKAQCAFCQVKIAQCAIIYI